MLFGRKPSLKERKLPPRGEASNPDSADWNEISEGDYLHSTLRENLPPCEEGNRPRHPFSESLATQGLDSPSHKFALNWVRLVWLNDKLNKQSGVKVFSFASLLRSEKKV
ncbi:hypothetical protein TNCV_4428301 [Trichonephila clavipes]|nr:hypothetical protein TNCV_4428301 [Trichonephila clavipes]